MYRLTPLRLIAVLCLSFFLTTAPAIPAVQDASDPDLLQFTSAGHVLGFAPGAMVVATGSHALRVEFVDARSVTPQSAAASEERATPLTSVTYSNLWDGITLTFDATGIVRSTYRLEPYAKVSAIHLRYNRPLHVQANGSLLIEFDTGAMHESAPIAWQEIDGKRVPVTVAFKTLSASEIGFAPGAYDPALPLFVDPTLTWNTFLGGIDDDVAFGIAVDGNGNVYVGGSSSASWGTPVNPHTGEGGSSDAFAAKLNSSGVLQWHTFMGSSNFDRGTAIAVDGSANVYVAGDSYDTWGTPVNPHAGVNTADVFVVKLNSSGVRQWHTFMGSSNFDHGTGLAVDGGGNVYVAGYSDTTWGAPVNPHTGGGGNTDAFAAKLNSSGVLQWNTFMGSSNFDFGDAVAVDGSGNVYVAGSSNATWGTPVNPYAGTIEVFAAKLNSSGVRQWHTFMGSSNADFGRGIAVDGSGNVYVGGFSDITWGTPVNPHTGDERDAFAAKLNSSGVLQWNTFMGSSNFVDSGQAIAVDGSNNVYVAGFSGATWGTPLNPHAGANDAFAAKLNSSGVRQWHTFMGSSSDDFGNAIAVDASSNVYVAGFSSATWGTPVNPHAGAGDAFVAKISNPAVTINQADGQADPTTTSPINFTAIFDEPVTGFGNSIGDVTVSGTAGATTAVVTETAPNDGTTYNVAVSGMTGNGTVVADIPAGVANDADGNPNAASTSTDNTVTFTASAAPSCAGQPATIYVDGQGRIVGGPHNGKLYRGKLHGTSGADVMVGTSGPDEIDGKSGNDRICGLGGNDTLKGGSGNDTLEGGPGADQFKGGSGTDTVIDFNPGQGDTKTSVENF